MPDSHEAVPFAFSHGVGQGGGPLSGGPLSNPASGTPPSRDGPGPMPPSPAAASRVPASRAGSGSSLTPTRPQAVSANAAKNASQRARQSRRNTQHDYELVLTAQKRVFVVYSRPPSARARHEAEMSQPQRRRLSRGGGCTTITRLKHDRDFSAGPSMEGSLGAFHGRERAAPRTHA